MRYILMLLILILSWPLFAKDVYKWTNEDGVVIYSDNYRPDAERVRVPSNKSAWEGTALPENADTETAASGGGYEKFAIAQPENDETVRSDEGRVTVGLSISPALAAGHAIQVWVDGSKLEGELKGTQFTLNQLNRGTHTLEARIVDADGQSILSTPRINFHLRKAAVPTP